MADPSVPSAVSITVTLTKVVEIHCAGGHCGRTLRKDVGSRIHDVLKGGRGFYRLRRRDGNGLWRRKRWELDLDGIVLRGDNSGILFLVGLLYEGGGKFHTVLDLHVQAKEST